MILSDGDIFERVGTGSLVIEPYEESNVEPASVDLRLSDSFKKPVSTGQIIDTRGDAAQEYREFEADSIVLEPGESILAETTERIELPDDLCADVVGRSSLGRLFVSVHKTAGFGDPGFRGTITLEMTNGNPDSVRLHNGDRVCQIIFKRLSSPALHPYGHEGSQYQGQHGATESGMQFE
jgi:dCTP deaminase